MYVHSFDAAWLDHPFWRTRFVVDDEADLRRIRESAVRSCWIDVERGIDVAVPETPAGANRVAAPGPAAALPPQADDARAALRPDRTPPASIGDELQRAAEVCKRARGAVLAMYTDVRLGKAVDAEACLPLVEEVSASVFRNPGALVSLARLKTRDDYTYMHSVAVCALMVALGRQLGFDEAACREAGLAGLLHDIGKALMPVEVLNKPGKLTEAEFDLMRSHPARGHELLEQARSVGASALDVCLHHHEKFDGGGYPGRLAGERISLLARMGAVCDVYDAITSNRPYKAGWDPAESVARMASWKGHFDEPVFAAFVRSIGIYPTGSLVRMASGRLAVVIEQNANWPAQPVVRVFHSLKSQMPIPPQRIDLAQGGRDRIVGREPPERWNFPQLDALWLDADLRR
jgi:putative nucleotidyltransferase with HDIG domain